MARRRKKHVEPVGTAPRAHFQGIGYALLLTAVIVILLATITTLTSISEVVAQWTAVVFAAIAVLWGSYYTCRKLGNTGWLNGGIVGAGYVLILLLLSILLDLGISMHGLVTLAVGFGLGAIGGVMGINSR